MANVKIFKDATQGYIELDKKYVINLIDTYEMQRLKDVAQTGIRPVYTGASHDRFSHSLGVYNIGQKIIKAFIENVIGSLEKSGVAKSEDIKKYLIAYKEYYAVACLLHDIGHSPYSHNFEYLYENAYLSLDERDTKQDRRNVDYIDEEELARIIKARDSNEKKFKEKNNFYLKNRVYEELKNFYEQFNPSDGGIDDLTCPIGVEKIKGADHELMGAFQILTSKKLQLAIQNVISPYFPSSKGGTDKLSGNIDYGFIVCMITGTKYRIDENSVTASLRNCIINLLNGVIDADSIDYLNRNAHFAGYTTSSLDISRLTGAFSAQYSSKKNIFIPCLEKSALSVIDGFIEARNFEPKWLYSHHKIVYCENFLYRYLYKKSTRFTFAADQEKWESLIVNAFRKELRENKSCYADIVSLRSKKTVPSDFESCLNLYRETVSKLIESSNDLQKEIIGKMLAFDSDYDDSQLRQLDQKIFKLSYRSKIEKYRDLQDIKLPFSKDSGEKFGIDGLNACYSLKAFLCLLICQLAEDLESNSVEITNDMVSRIEKWNFLLNYVKDSYLSLYLSPVNEFRRDPSDSTCIYKTSDSGMDTFLKEKYLYFKDKNFCELNEAEKKVTSERDFNMYKDALEEFETRKYRTSLWKSEEEYNLFLSKISQRVGLSVNAINGIIVDKLISQGTVEEFEDVKLYGEVSDYTKIKDANLVFVNTRNSTFKSSIPSENFHNIFGFLKEGMIITIYKEKFKDFGSLLLHFEGGVYDDENSNGLISYEKLFGKYKKPTVYFPYIYYKEKDVEGKTRKELLTELEKNLEEYILRNLGGEKGLSISSNNFTKGEWFKDPVYGDVFVPNRFLKIIETKAFQRLRRIKQLATADYVFTNAEHTRFAHSIGTFYVMSLIVEHYCTLFDYLHIEYTAAEKDAALAAALLHDIGHGPFSHAFEKITTTDGKTHYTSHEEWTKKIIQEDPELKKVLEEEFNGNSFSDYIIDCLDCENVYAPGDFGLKNVFASLISSQLDADRIDYLLRDSFNTGVKFGTIDLNKLVSSLSLSERDGKKVVCFDESAVPVIEHFIIERYNMYDSVYLSPYKAISEKMLSKIVLRISDNPKTIGHTQLEKILNGTITTSEYLELDDVSFKKELMDCVSNSDDQILKDMIDSFNNRRGYKRLRILNETGQNNLDFLNEFKAKYKKDYKDFFGIIYFADSFNAYNNGVTSNALSKQICIAKNNGEIVDFDKVSRIFTCDPVTYEVNKNYLPTVKSYIYINKDILKQEWLMSDGSPFLGEQKNLIDFNNFIESWNIHKITEIEQKYSCSAEDIQKGNNEECLEKLKVCGYKKEERSSVTTSQEDLYYDTEDYLLAQKGFTLRCRFSAGKYQFTLKSKINQSENVSRGQFLRTEFVIDSESDRIDSPEVSHFVLNHLKSLMDDENRELHINDLLPLVNIDNTRTQYKVQRSDVADSAFECVVNLDSVNFSRYGNKDVKKTYQIEIELNSENPIYHVELWDFAKKYIEVMGFHNLCAKNESKYIQALTELDLFSLDS